VLLSAEVLLLCVTHVAVLTRGIGGGNSTSTSSSSVVPIDSKPTGRQIENQHSPTSPLSTAGTYLARVPWAANVSSLPADVEFDVAVVEFAVAAVDVVLVVLAVAAVAADAVAAQGRALEAKMVHSLEWWRSRRFLYCPSPSFQLAATFRQKKNTK
jgi:hypothetical protein